MQMWRWIVCYILAATEETARKSTSDESSFLPREGDNVGNSAEGRLLFQPCSLSMIYKKLIDFCQADNIVLDVCGFFD